MTITPVPKPQPISELEKRTARLAQLKKLERSRRKPLARKSGAGVKPSGKPRRKAKKRDRNDPARIYGSHAEYIRSLPCFVCGHEGHTVAAHTATGGMGRKADASTLVPLCSTRLDGKRGWVEGCHEESHRRGIKTFEARYAVDLKAFAARLARHIGGGE